MNAKEQTEFFKHFKIVKLIQIIVLFSIEIVFFLIMMLHPTLRNSVYSNPNLFILSSMMWGIMLFSFVCILYDFSQMEKVTRNTHQLNKLAYLDDMTGIPNRYSCDLIFKTYCEGENMDTIGCGIMMISNLVEINDKHGHEAGDTAIQDFSQILDEVGSEYGFVGRNSGNEFLAVFEECDDNKMKTFFNALDNRLHLYNSEEEHAQVTFSYAYVLNSELHAKRFSDLITVAYKKLHSL